MIPKKKFLMINLLTLIILLHPSFTSINPTSYRKCEDLDFEYDQHDLYATETRSKYLVHSSKGKLNLIILTGM